MLVTQQTYIPSRDEWIDVITEDHTPEEFVEFTNWAEMFWPRMRFVADEKDIERIKHEEDFFGL